MTSAYDRAADARMDAAITAYYASRVTDPREAQWRADYTRMIDRTNRAGLGAGGKLGRELSAQAEEIDRRWSTDPEIAPRWAELTELHELSAESVGRPRAEVPDMATEVPAGTDPITWRSGLQAHDITGVGRWPEPARARSALADYQPGRGLAAQTGVERDGAER